MRYAQLSFATIRATAATIPKKTAIEKKIYIIVSDTPLNLNFGGVGCLYSVSDLGVSHGSPVTKRVLVAE